MTKFLPGFIMILLLGIVPYTNAQNTSYDEDFSGELDDAVWVSQEGYSHSIVDGQLKTNIQKKDESENFRINFDESPVDVSANPVLNLEVKANKAIKLDFYFFSGTFYIKQVSIPKSDILVPISINFEGAPSKFDLTALKYIDVYVNKDAVAYNGTLTIDNFLLGDGAVDHANIGGIKSPVLYSGEKSQKLIFKDIVNAESVSISGIDAYFENIMVSPILQSTFSDYAYITFDVKEGVEGSGNMEVTAQGAGDYNDNTLSIPFEVLSNMAPTINPVEDVEVETGKTTMIKLSGISDGDDNLDQSVSINAASSDQSVVSDSDIKISYKDGSPYATLYMEPLIAGSSEITVNVDDGQDSNNQNSVSFTLNSYDNLNLPPTVNDITDQVPYYDGTESTIMLTGLSDGNNNTQNLSFTLTSSVDTIVEEASLSISDYDPASRTAILHYTPVGEGTSTITLTVSDDNAGTDNGVKETTVEFQAKPVTLYPRGLDWEVARDGDRWGGDSGITATEDTFDGSDVIKVNAIDKWIWGALNFSFSDTSVNLTEHPYVSLDVYSVDTRTLHWLWFYDDYELTHDGAHRNDFSDVTHDEGKAVWVEPNQWTTITFDFSGENEMSRKVGDEAVPINAKRIVRILYNFHDKENVWPRPPEYTGTFYIRNFRVGNKAIIPDPFTTIDPVPDQVTYTSPGPQSIAITGLSDGREGLPDVSVESLNAAFVSPAVSAVSSDGTATLNYDPGAMEGEAQVVLTVSAVDAQTVTDTFMIKTVAKESGSASGVEIDMSQKYQTWRGMGTFQNQYFDLYTQEMGATAMRVGIIGNQIEHTNDNYDPYVLDRSGLDYNAFDWDALRKMKEMGVETFILTSWSAPGWMKDNHDESWFKPGVVKWDKAENRTSPFYYDEWAEYFVAAYRMFEEEAGIQLEGIGIQNEPAFYEPYPSAILSPEEFAKIIAVVGKRFEEEGIETKLFMPEQVFSQPNYSMAEYMDALHANPEADKYTDVIGVHGYASDGIGAGTPDFSAWTSMYNKAQEGIGNKELWMTETRKVYNSYDDAMWIAMAIYGGMEYGNMGLWTQWGIVSQHIIDGNPTQMLYVLANYSRFIKPDAVRVKSTSSHEDLFTTAWMDDEEGIFATVAINDGDTPISAYLTGDNVPDNYEMYLTTAIRGCEYMGETEDSMFVVPPQSVMTLVARGNAAPTIDPVENMMLELDAPQQTVTLTGIDAVEELQAITDITAISSNTLLIDNPTVGTLQEDGTTSLTFQPVAGQSGETTISVTVTDDGPSFVSNATTMEFKVMVYDAFNNPPEVARINDQYVLEDMEGTHAVSVAMNDGDDGTQTLTGSVTTDNPDMITNLSYNSTSQSIEFGVAPEYYGEATIELTVTDDGGSGNNNGDQSAERDFKVFVASVNDAPGITPVEDMIIGMNAPEQTVVVEGIDKGDTFGEDQSITVTAVADDLSLITPPAVEYNQGATADIKFSPIRNMTGTINITVYVLDDGGVMNGGTDLTTMTFAVEITPTDINQAPYMDPIADMNLYLSEGAETIDLQGVDDGDPDEEQTISVSATSSDEGVVAAPIVNWVPSLGLGSIKLTPVSTGTSTITVVLEDDGGTDFGGVNTQEYSFVVTVKEDVGIDRNAAQGIKIYPNPAQDQVFVSMPEGFKDYNISVTDLAGKVVVSKIKASASGEHMLNISDLDAGMYVLIIETRDENHRSVFIKK